jgi:hypothetical protein
VFERIFLCRALEHGLGGTVVQERESGGGVRTSAIGLWYSALIGAARKPVVS